MIKIYTSNGLTVILDNVTQSEEEYRQAYECMKAMVHDNFVTKLFASGRHLFDIEAAFNGIPKPGDEFTCAGFTWIGDFAKIIVANILSSVYDDDSFIITHPKDLYDCSWHNK